MPMSPEDRVRQLAKQNTTCPNCHQTKKFGFGTVCIKFHTFVCNECKTSHQAVSHRCKSITMSTWTHAEVDELEQKGNAYCEQTWLAKAPPVGQGGRPTTGSSIDVFKRFVVDAYDHKRYYSEQPVSNGNATTVPNFAQPQPPQQQQQNQSHSTLKQNASSQKVESSIKAPPQPAADFFDFAAFDTTPVDSHGAAVLSRAAVAAAEVVSVPSPSDPFAPDTSSSHFTRNYQQQHQPIPTMTATAPSASSSSSFDPFADFTTLSISNNTNMTSASTTNSSFSFLNETAATTTTTTTTPAVVAANKKPIMNTGSNNAISHMSSIMNNTSNNNATNLNYLQQQQQMNRNNGMTSMMSSSFGMNGMMSQATMNPSNGSIMNNNMNNFSSGTMWNPSSTMNSMAMNTTGSSNSNTHLPFHSSNGGGFGGPVMSYHGGSSTTISNMGALQQQQQQKQKDAFSDLLPF